MKARYFQGGAFEDMTSCYVAQVGEYYAHGETIPQALSDARFKHMQATMDVSSVVQEIKKAGHFTRETFRLLTGACFFGTEQFLKDRGLSEKETLPIAETLRVTRGAYGWHILQEHFGDYAEAA